MASELGKGLLRITSNYARLVFMVSMGIVLVPLVLNGATDIGFGLWGMLGATAGFGDMFKEIVQTSMNRELGDAYHRGDDAYFKKVINSAFVVSVTSMFFGVCIYAAIYFCLPLLNIEASWMPTARTIVIFQGISSAVAIGAAPLFNLYIVSERMGMYNAWLVAERSSYLLAAIVWVVLFPIDDPQETLVRFAITGALCAVCVVTLASLVMLFLDRRTLPKPSLADRTEIVSIVKTSGWNGVVSAALNMHIRLDQLLVNLWFGLAGNAVFVAAVRLASYIRMITVGMTDGLDVVAARLSSQQQGDRLTTLVPRVTKMHAMIAIPAAVFVLVYAPHLLELWIGKQLDDTQLQRCVTTVRILAIGMCARGISDGWIRLLYGAGYIKRYAPVILIGGLMNPIVAFTLFRSLHAEQHAGEVWSSFNAPAIAFASIFMTAHLLWIPRVVQRCLGVSVRTLVKPIIRPAIMGACLFVFGAILTRYYHIHTVLDLGVHVVAISVVGVVLLLVVVADPRDRGLVSAMLGKIVSRFRAPEPRENQ